MNDDDHFHIHLIDEEAAEEFHQELAQYEEEVIRIRANVVAPKSLKVYRASSSKFLLWLSTHNRSLLNPSFRQELDNVDGTVTQKKRWIVQYLENATTNNSPAPVLCEQLTASKFLTWIVSLKKANDTEDAADIVAVENMSFSTYNSHRSGLHNLFREFKVDMPVSLQNELRVYFM